VTEAEIAAIVLPLERQALKELKRLDVKVSPKIQAFVTASIAKGIVEAAGLGAVSGSYGVEVTVDKPGKSMNLRVKAHVPDLEPHGEDDADD
jgi:hypothetical protein